MVSVSRKNLFQDKTRLAISTCGVGIAIMLILIALVSIWRRRLVRQQRVAIARALANDPSIILADEPTGNLDSESGRLVMNMLKKIAKKNKSVVIVSHDPRIKSIADRVIHMEDGKLGKGGKR